MRVNLHKEAASNERAGRAGLKWISNLAQRVDRRYVLMQINPSLVEIIFFFFTHGDVGEATERGDCQ